MHTCVCVLNNFKTLNKFRLLKINYSSVIYAGRSCFMSNMSGENQEPLWIFGYGANMSGSHLSRQKGVNILDQRRCILHGYQLRFNLVSLYTKSEPAFASVQRCQASDAAVHGVAFALSPDDAKKIDAFEVTYNRRLTRLSDYDGNEFDGFVYECSKPEMLAASDGKPSRRYLALLLQGARAAKLQRQYIRQLLKVPTFSTSEADLLRREQLLRRPLESFTSVSWQQAPENSVSIFGYLFDIGSSWNKNLNSMKGKELSLLLLRFYHGGDLRSSAPPPFPSISHLRLHHPEACDYVMTWLDTFLDMAGACAGRLEGYEQQCCDQLQLPQPIVYPLRQLTEFDEE